MTNKTHNQLIIDDKDSYIILVKQKSKQKLRPQKTIFSSVTILSEGSPGPWMAWYKYVKCQRTRQTRHGVCTTQHLHSPRAADLPRNLDIPQLNRLTTGFRTELLHATPDTLKLG